MNRDHSAQELSLLQQKRSPGGDCFLLEDEMIAFHSICNDIDTQYDGDDTDRLVTMLEDSAVAGSGVSQDISSPVLAAVMQSMGESSDDTHEDRDRSTAARGEVMRRTMINESSECAMAANAVFVAPLDHIGQDVIDRLGDNNLEKNTYDMKNVSKNVHQRLPRRAAARKALERSRLAFEDASNAEIVKSNTRKGKSKKMNARDDGMNPRQSKPYDDMIDPNLPADQIRKLRRLLSNRQSARKARLRRQEQIQELETALQESSKVIARLEMDLAESIANRIRIGEENMNLRNEVERLQTVLHMQGAFDEKSHDIPFDSMGLL
jgi:hypothetical protein